MLTFFVGGVFIWLVATHVANRLLHQKSSTQIAAKETFYRTVVGWIMLLFFSIILLILFSSM